MVDTFTPKLGLRQYDASGFYDVNKFSADNLLIDNAFGTIICTSTTRPSTGLFNGMQLWETDTERFVVRVAGAWVVAPIMRVMANQAARDAIVTPYQGMTIYRLDRAWEEKYDGVGWRIQGVAICASTADRDAVITRLYDGQYAYTTDTKTLWVRHSGVWNRQVSRGLIARGRRSTNSATSTSAAATAVLRLDNIQAYAGNALRVCTGSLHTTSTVGGDNIRVEIRYNTSGVASTASAVLPGARAYELYGTSSFGNTSMLETIYVPAVNETVSLLLCVAREAGSGNVTLFADGTRMTEMFVYDTGVDPGNTGVIM